MPVDGNSPASVSRSSVQLPRLSRDSRMDGNLPSEPPTAGLVFHSRDRNSPEPHVKTLNAQKIYIGGLPEIARLDDLHDCFSQLGTILNVELKTGYGFVVSSSTLTRPQHIQRTLSFTAASTSHNPVFLGLPVCIFRQSKPVGLLASSISSLL